MHHARRSAPRRTLQPPRPHDSRLDCTITNHPLYCPPVKPQNPVTPSAWPKPQGQFSSKYGPTELRACQPLITASVVGRYTVGATSLVAQRPTHVLPSLDIWQSTSVRRQPTLDLARTAPDSQPLRMIRRGCYKPGHPIEVPRPPYRGT